MSTKRHISESVGIYFPISAEASPLRTVKKLIIGMLLILIATTSFAQLGFVIKSDTAFYNVKMKDQGAVKNGLSCIMGKRNDAQTEYTPYQVIQYGTAGKIYQAQTVNLNGKNQRVFLELLTRGKLRLYAFKAKDSKPVYFIADGDTLTLSRINSTRTAFRWTPRGRSERTGSSRTWSGGPRPRLVSAR